MLSSLEEKIKNHSEQIQKKKKPYTKKCPRCNIQPRYFQRHSTRDRKFLVRIKNIVKEVFGVLMRWRCSDCQRTFTDYPSFCVRYKHYLKDSLIDKCEEYVENAGTSYYKLSKFVGYENGGKIDERKLAKSTIWRWCGDLGGREDLCKCLLKLLLDTKPELKIYETFYPIVRWKYRSPKRKICLEFLQKICCIIPDLEALLNQCIFFTDFETW